MGPILCHGRWIHFLEDSISFELARAFVTFISVLSVVDHFEAWQ